MKTQVCGHSTKFLIKTLTFIFALSGSLSAKDLLILQSDFSLKDGAVCEMHLAALMVDRSLRTLDNTHAIEPQNIIEGAYRLYQVAFMSPADVVFVSVVDPGVGTDRKAIVARSKAGFLIVTPDNGTISFVDHWIGIESAVEIDINKWRRPNSAGLNTFDGRDVFAHVGALLASEKVKLEDLGKPLAVESLVRFEVPKAYIDGDKIIGNVTVLDPNFGNVWTNIPESFLRRIGLEKGQQYEIVIRHEGREVLRKKLPFYFAFGDVPNLEELMNFNSLGFVSFSKSLGSFAKEHSIGTKGDWRVEISRTE